MLLGKNKDVLTTTIALKKGCLIKAETLAGTIDSLAKTMQAVSEEMLKLGNVEVRVKDIKIKKDRVIVSLKPDFKTK